VCSSDLKWGQQKLGNIVGVYDGTHQTPNYVDNGVMFLSVENIATLDSNKFISELDFNQEFKISPEQGDVLMTRIGDIGTTNVVQTNEKLAYYVSLALLKPKDLDSKFLAMAIQSPAVQKEIWKRTIHAAFPKKINKGEIENIALYTPDKAEQIAIGNFFKSLDEQIVAQQQKQDSLKRIKAAYLQKMFI
jgi:type I restriction enzyme S subunit